MLRIAICDDLKSERDMVKGFLRSFFAAVPYEYTLAEYSRGETMVDDYDDGSVDFDLIFMDIFMACLEWRLPAVCGGTLPMCPLCS